MKKTVSYILFTTGAALVILALFSIFIVGDVELIDANVVLEIFLANIVINFGLFLRWKFEIRYVILEYLVDISYTIIVLVIFGLIFDWYSAVPLWLLVVMATVIYLFAIIITFTKIRKDTAEMNELLQKHKEKQADTAS